MDRRGGGFHLRFVARDGGRGHAEPSDESWECVGLQLP